MRTSKGVLAAVLWLSVVGVGHAQVGEDATDKHELQAPEDAADTHGGQTDASPPSDTKDQAAAPAEGGSKTVFRLNRLVEELTYEGPALEQLFVEAQLSLWLPGFWTFDRNHTTSVQVSVELGTQVVHVWRHHFFVVGGVLVSPQVLEQHLGADAATMVTPWIGLRYMHDSTCTRDGSGCWFAELGTGLTFEVTDDDDETHHAPHGAWTALFGVGYRKHISAHAHLGARIDFAYLDDTWTSELAWITPTVFGGTSF